MEQPHSEASEIELYGNQITTELTKPHSSSLVGDTEVSRCGMG